MSRTGESRPDPRANPSRRWWPRWIALVLFVAVMGTVFVRLGEWQWHRLEHRRELNAAVVANTAAPVRPWSSVWKPVITDADAWQRVEISGTFDATHQFRAMYRNDAGGTRGSAPITPLRTSDGRTLLVDRGFLADTSAGVAAVLPAPPSGTVTVVGYVRRNEVGKASLVTPDQGAMRLVNSVEIAKQLPYRVENGWVQLLSVTPAQTGGLVPQGTPELSEGPHFSYAIQWFLFTVVGVVGTVVLIRGDLRDRRKARAQANARTPTSNQARRA